MFMYMKVFMFFIHIYTYEHISILIMFMILMYVAFVVNSHNNIIQILTFRFDFSKTWVTKCSHI